MALPASPQQRKGKPSPAPAVPRGTTPGWPGAEVRKDRAVLAALVAVYLATRLVALTTLPIFVDETSHIRWSVWIAQGEKLDKPWQYGKGLPVFANALVFPWAQDHYLWASRAVTVLFGAGTLLGTVALARRLGGVRPGRIAGLLYVLSPFALFYDRLALTDPALGTFAVLVALLSLRVAEDGRLRDGALLGVCLTLAVFSKALGVILFFAPVGAVLMVAPRRLRRPGALLVAYGVALAATAYPMLRFFQLTSTVRVAVSRGQGGTLDRLIENLPVCASWLWTYWTGPFVVLGVLAVAVAAVRRARPVLFASTMVVVPLLALAAVSDLWFPRYLVFLNGPFLALAAWGWDAIAGALARRAGAVRPALLAAGSAAILLPAVRLDVDLLVDPPRANLPVLDRIQFITGWPSGYGVRETLAFARDQRARRPEGLTVVTHSQTLRTTARALGLEFAGDPSVRVENLNFDEPEGALPLLAGWVREKPTVVVIEPVRASSRRPSPELFAPLGGRLAARTFKPNGDLCDEIYVLCSGAAAGACAP